jgi:hypothetical protein
MRRKVLLDLSAKTVAAAPVAGCEAKSGGCFINGTTFTSLVYAGV